MSINVAFAISVVTIVTGFLILVAGLICEMRLSKPSVYWNKVVNVGFITVTAGLLWHRSIGVGKLLNLW